MAADWGYDDGENHEFLRDKGIDSAIHLNSYRTKKKDKNREIWVRLCVRHPEDASPAWQVPGQAASEGKESPSYQRGMRERKKIEGKFGEMKKHHGFGRCRYLELLRYAIQGYLTAIAVSLKRMVKLLAGVGLKSPKKSRLWVT